jgi:hypothetical protein
MFCPAVPFEMVCCLCPAGLYGMVKRAFRPAHMSWYNAVFGRSISTGTPFQPASPYGIVLNLIWLAHMG